MRNEVCSSANDWFDKILAFQVFKAEQDGEEDITKIKEKWDQLQDIERRDFIARVKAESDFKEQLRSFKSKKN